MRLVRVASTMILHSPGLAASTCAAVTSWRRLSQNIFVTAAIKAGSSASEKYLYGGPSADVEGRTVGFPVSFAVEASRRCFSVLKTSKMPAKSVFESQLEE